MRAAVTRGKTQKDGNERLIDGNTLVVYVGVEEMR